MRLVPARLGHVARRLVRAPLFTGVAILTLGLGIGATTAMFSVVYGVLLKAVAVRVARSAGRCVAHGPGMGQDLMNQGPATYFTYRDENRVFDANRPVGRPVRVGHRCRRARAGARVDGERRDAGGARCPASPGTPVRREGRHAGNARDGPAGLCLLAAEFAGDPGVVGRPLTVEGRPREIIGVLPQSFHFLDSDPALLLPFRFDRARVFVGNFSYQAVARLKDGVTLEQANADLARMIPLVIERFPLPPGFTRDMFVEIRMGRASVRCRRT